MEIWKDIIGFEDKYQISNLGNIKSLKRCTIRVFENHTSRLFVKEKILNPVLSSKTNGYFRVSLGNRQYSVHRLLAIHFLPNSLNLPCVNHLDGNKQNNALSNLEWCTHSENTKHAFRIGLFDHVNLKSNCIKVMGEDGTIYNSLTEVWELNKGTNGVSKNANVFKADNKKGKTKFKRI